MASSVAKQLRYLRVKARRRGLVANLSLSEWKKTVKDFQGRCAYCDGIGWTIDHFLSMASGGGTMIENCLPCCWLCNNRKGSLSPEAFARLSSHVSLERIEQLRLYLKRRGAGLRGWSPSGVPHLTRTPCMAQRKKEDSMTTQEMHRSKTALSQGREFIVLNTPSQIVLQLQQHKVHEDDLLSPVVNVAAVVTPQECLALATELLRVASPFLEKPAVSIPEPDYSFS